MLIKVTDRKKQTVIKIENYSLYKAITPNGWSIVIMDDNILFDNYYNKGVYVHYNPNNHNQWVKIKEISVDQLFLLVYNHIKLNKKLGLEKLLMELK